MQTSIPRARTAWIPIVAALALRALGLIPFALDDDEAWFSTSGISFGQSGQLFKQVLDNKPPGMTWFYEAVARIFGTGNLPILARTASLPLLLVGALACGAVAARSLDPAWVESDPQVKERTRDITATLMLLGISSFHPKALSLSNEALMLPLITLAYLLIGPADSACRVFLGGALLGMAMLIKQTAIFFIGPVLVMTPRLSCFGALVAGFALAPGLTAWNLGFSEYLYWNWTYPSSVLYKAREKLFSGVQPAFINSGIFAVALAPLGLSLSWPNRRTLFLWFWLGAALLAVFAGKGLFPHYFLLLVPPLAGLAGIRWARVSPPRWMHAWTWTTAAACCGLAAFPTTGLVWGNDLNYYRLLAQRIEWIAPPAKSWHVWGSNALPLALAASPSYGKFVTSRFLVPPYATGETLHDFFRLLDLSPPGMLLDVHARGDNQFNFPIGQNPELARTIARDYSAIADPALPWASFLLRKNTREVEALLTGFCRSQNLERSTDYYPQSMRELRLILRQPFAVPWKTADRLLRIHFTLEILRNACPWADVRVLSGVEGGVRTALRGLSLGRSPESSQVSSWEDSVREYFANHRYQSPFALDAPAWWISLALVELQPVAKPR